MHNRGRERLERGQVAFDLKAIHIIEAAVISNSTNKTTSNDGCAPQQLVESCNRADVPLYVIPLEAVFLAMNEPLPLDSSGCCSSLPRLQTDLQRLLQVDILASSKVRQLALVPPYAVCSILHN